MIKFYSKIIISLFFWVTFAIVIFQIPYPDSLTQANFYQLIPFFSFLFFALIFTLNIFLKNILSSFSISLGLIFLLTLKALDSFNIVTAILVAITVALLVSYFSKKNNQTVKSKSSKLKSL